MLWKRSYYTLFFKALDLCHISANFFIISLVSRQMFLTEFVDAHDVKHEVSWCWMAHLNCIGTYMSTSFRRTVYTQSTKPKTQHLSTGLLWNHGSSLRWDTGTSLWLFSYCPGTYGQLMVLPESCMSRISVSMGVLPTSRMKKSWEMRLAGTALRAGSRSRSRPKRCGWPGYCMRSYSVRATCAFSCRLSMCAGSDSPHASAGNRTKSLQHRCKWNPNGKCDGYLAMLFSLWKRQASKRAMKSANNLKRIRKRELKIVNSWRRQPCGQCADIQCHCASAVLSLSPWLADLSRSRPPLSLPLHFLSSLHCPIKLKAKPLKSWF